MYGVRARAPTRIVNPISERHYIVAPDVPPSIASTRGTTEDCVRGVRKHECELKRLYHLNSLQLTKTGRTMIQSR